MFTKSQKNYFLVDNILNEVKMTDYSQTAMWYFKQGYNCSQAVMATFYKEMNMDFETAVKISSSFGGGMGRLREVCGAVSGMFMVAGILYGYDNPNDKIAKTKHYKFIQELAQRFKEQNKSIICRELLGIGTGANKPLPDDRTKEYYQKRPCVQIVGMAAGIIGDLINKNKSEDIYMKIAVACQGEQVTEHFGHCENFMIFDVKNNEVITNQSIPNPGHKPGFLPNFLNDLGVNVIISGGMGSGAVEIFNEKNIKVITGAFGVAKDVVIAFLNGTLISSGIICQHNH